MCILYDKKNPFKLKSKHGAFFSYLILQLNGEQDSIEEGRRGRSPDSSFRADVEISSPRQSLLSADSSTSYPSTSLNGPYQGLCSAMV